MSLNIFKLQQESLQVLQSKQLHKALMYNGRITIKPSAKRAADSFRLLESKDHIKPEIIQLVLDWYCKHLKDEYIPICHSARGFRAKFDRIQAAMNRSESPTVEISDKAKRISKRLWFMEWPNKEKEQELIFIQMTINNYSQFRKDLIALRDREREKCPPPRIVNGRTITRSNAQTSFCSLIQYLISTISSEENYTQGYTEEVNKIAHTWPGWKGNLLKWVWTRDSKIYRKFMLEHVWKYTERDTDWDRILKALEN